MQQMKINELIPHPRNTEFFDDMSGEKWTEFLESIKTSGVIEPIVITQDKIIVSGHQRVRACKELGLTEILADVRVYDSDKKHTKDDKILKDLLETNIRQRGNIGGSAKKVGLRIKELERIYGIQQGNNQHSRILNNSESLKTQPQLAKELGISVDTLNNYKKLTEMIPELEELVNTGIVSTTAALAIIKSLSKEEQEKFILSLDTTKKLTQKQVQEYINKNKELQSELKEKNNNVSNLSQQVSSLKKELTTKSQIIKTVEVIPKDYEKVKQDLENSQKDYQYLDAEYQKRIKELEELRKQIQIQKEQEPSEDFQKKIKDNAIYFCSRVAEFIEKMGGYVWLTDYINDLPQYEKKSYLSAINAIVVWSQVLSENIKNKKEK